MGHAVYSLSDPREVVFKGYVEQLDFVVVGGDAYVDHPSFCLLYTSRCV